METISNTLAKQFAKKVVSSSSQQSKSSTSTGSTSLATLKVSNGTTYAVIDGSTVMTPVSMSMSGEDGDRVLVTIQNHSAIVTANVTAPAATTKHVERVEADLTTFKDVTVKTMLADYVKTNELESKVGTFGYVKTDELEGKVGTFGYLKTADLEGEVGKFGYLKTDELEGEVGKFGYLKVSDAELTYVKTDELEGKVGTFGYLKATDAELTYVKTNELEGEVGKFGYLKADDAELAYAKINFTNVGEGVIGSALIADGAITNAKIHDVSANKLTAGTIDASKITVTNLNADNLTVGTINGKLIGSGTVDLDSLAEEVPTKEYLDSVQSDLQNQIDGAIETFTATETPTLKNEPAVNWKDNATKAKHVGDVCYVLNESSAENGYCYRFANTGTASAPVYEWVLIKDSDVTKALKDLATAQGDISGLKSYDVENSKWRTETDSSIESLVSQTESLETELGTKVDVSTFNTVKQAADSNTASITKLTTTVNSKADASTVTTLSNTVNTVKQTADKNTSSISSLTSKVDNATEDISALETKQSTLEQSLDGFKTTVSSTYVTKTAYDSKVTDLESDIDTATTTANTASANASTALSTANASVASVAVEYYVSTSATALSGGSWSTTQPTWTDGSYIWARTKTTTKGGTVSYSNAACVTGATGTQGTKGDKGDTGATGNGVKSIVPQYYLSTSSTTRTGGSWSSAEPTWKSGTYIWTRSYITWTNGTTSTTTPVLATTLNTLNTRVTTAETNIEQNKNDITLRATKTEVATAKSEAISTASKDATTKANNALSNAKTYADSQIKVSADNITSTVASTYATQDALSSAESKIQQNADNIELKVNKDGIISTINQSAEGISISADKINLDGVVTINDYIKMNEDGSLVATNGTFTGVVNATSGSFTGKIDASTGKIGNWTIGSTMLYNGTNSMTSTTAGTYIGTNGITQVSTDGCLNIQNGNILARNNKREAKSGYQFTKTRWLIPDSIADCDGNAGIIFFNESSKNLMQVQKADKTRPFYIERDGTVHMGGFTVTNADISATATYSSNTCTVMFAPTIGLMGYRSNPNSVYNFHITPDGQASFYNLSTKASITSGGHIVLDAGVGIYATNTSGVAANMINMNKSNNNVSINWGMYNKMLNGIDDITASSTNIYAGTDINFITTNGVNFKPYYRKGMSATFSNGINTAGFISASSKVVYFYVPLDRPYINGTPSVTFGSGIICRQQNKYLYGSSSSTYAKGTYSAEVSSSNLVKINVTFTNTTNVTYNNAPVGIHVDSITIKFS